jgi:hypothetical protein
MATELWLEDIHVGDRFRTDVYELTADDIVDFAPSGTRSRFT